MYLLRNYITQIHHPTHPIKMRIRSNARTQTSGSLLAGMVGRHQRLARENSPTSQKKPSFPGSIARSRDKSTRGHRSLHHRKSDMCDRPEQRWLDRCLSSAPHPVDFDFIETIGWHLHRRAESRGFEGIVDVSGIAAGDVDNDGDTDVFLVPRIGPRYYFFITMAPATSRNRRSVVERI